MTHNAARERLGRKIQHEPTAAEAAEQLCTSGGRRQGREIAVPRFEHIEGCDGACAREQRRADAVRGGLPMVVRLEQRTERRAVAENLVCREAGGLGERICSEAE